jgi:hypothetical protein
MATKNGKSTQIQTFVKGQLEEAQKRFTALEGEAEKVLKNLVARGKESRKELEGLVTKLNAGELVDTTSLKTLGKKAGQAGSEVLEKIGSLQTRVVEAAGVASQSQLRELNKEISRLSKKLDSVLGGGKKTASKSEPRA